MKVLIAPDSFKGSLKASQACQILSRACLEVWPQAELVSQPLSDGGDGFLDIFKLKRINKTVLDPLGRKIQAEFGILEDQQCAVIELAQASGLNLLERSERNPMVSSTYGTGELIGHALDLGIRKFLIGLGGSATCDAGTGACQAFGVRFLNEKGQELSPCGENLSKIQSIDLDNLNPLILESSFSLACDTSSKLLGTDGAAKSYAPQKGADPKQVLELETGLEHYSNILSELYSQSFSELPFSAAAGGFGISLKAFCKARLVNGFNLVLDRLDLESKLSSCDLIVTAEGELNIQSSKGKVIGELAKIASHRDIPLLIFTGRIAESPAKMFGSCKHSVVSIAAGPSTEADCMKNASTLLERAAIHAFQAIRIGQTL